VLEGAFQYNRALRLLAGVEHQRRGRGDVNTPHQPAEGAGKQFLDGVVESVTAWRVGVRWEIIRDLFWHVDYRYRPHENYQRIQGRDVTGHQLALRLTVDY